MVWWAVAGVVNCRGTRATLCAVIVVPERQGVCCTQVVEKWTRWCDEPHLTHACAVVVTTFCSGPPGRARYDRPS